MLDQYHTRRNRKGIALLLDVTPQFYEAEPIKYEKLSLWYLFHYVRPYKKAMIQLIIGLLAGSLLQLVFPFLTQTIVDQGIGHRNLNFIQLIWSHNSCWYSAAHLLR